MFVSYNFILHKKVVDIEQVLPPELFALVDGDPGEIVWPIGKVLKQGNME